MKKIILSAVLFITFSTANYALAQTGAEKALDGLDTAAGWGYSNSSRPGSDVIDDIPLTIGVVVGYVLSFVGILFLLLMIYAGFLWMLAGGNDQQVQKAKSLIGAAVIGLIIVLAAYAFTAFLGQILTK
jgi:hypothetical protein